MELIKYKNRKLYSTELSRYVTLKDIMQEVFQGTEVTVRAHETNEDVTIDVLKQCVVSLQLTKPELLTFIKEGV